MLRKQLPEFLVRSEPGGLVDGQHLDEVLLLAHVQRQNLLIVRHDLQHPQLRDLPLLANEESPLNFYQF